MEEYKGTTSRNQLELVLGAQINALISASHALNVSVFTELLRHFNGLDS